MTATTKVNQAKVYNEIGAPEKRHGRELMSLLSIKEGSKVLDFGCGTGNLTEVLADMVGPRGEVVGVDPDGERIKFASERHSAGNLTYIQGSTESIPGSGYDIVYSNYVLHRCQDKEKVFKKMANILTKGGKFGFCTGCEFDGIKAFFTPNEAFSQEIIESFTSSLYSITFDEFKTLASTDFDIVHWKEIDYNFEFTSVKELVKFYMANSGKSDLKHINMDILEDYYEGGGGAIHAPVLQAILTKK